MSFPLSLPKCALARNKSISEHRIERPCSEVLDVVLGIRHQHLLNKVRAARQKHASGAHAKARKRAIIACGIEQEV